MKLTASVFLLLFTSTLFAQDCLTGWTWFRPLTIINSGNSSHTDQTISFQLNTGSLINDSKLQTNGGDFRITDEDCNFLHYFMDSTAGSMANVVWVKVPNISANDTIRLQVYYGNAAADSFANGDSTFLFFDEFSSDTVNLDKWEPIGGYAKLDVVDGVLNYASNGANPGPRFKFVRTRPAFSETVEFDFRARISNSNGFGFSSADSTISRILFRQAGFGFDTLNQVAFMGDTVSNGFQVEGMYPFIRFPRSQFIDGRIRAGIVDSLLTMDYFANLSDASSTDSVYQFMQEKMSGFHFIISSFLANQTVFLDYLRVRKPTPDSLSIEIGDESMAIANSIGKLTTALDLAISPNPAHDYLMIEGLPTGVFSVRLINIQGQRIFEEKIRALEGVETQIKLQEVPRGLYWLAISNENSILCAKAVRVAGK